MKALIIYCFSDYILSLLSYLVHCLKLDILFKSLNKNLKLDMTANSKASLAITLLTRYSYMILNERKSCTATNLVQNGLDYFRFTQYYRMMHINFVHWITLLHYPICFTI